MSRLDLLIGESCGQRVVILGTLAVYAYLVVRRPADAWTGAQHGATTVVHLATLIVAALFLSSAIGTLLPEDRLSELLGESAGFGEVAAAGLIAGLIPGGPYATYPVIKRIQESGAETPAVLTMLLGYGLISVGRVPYGLVFFTPTIVGLRLLTAGTATIIVGMVLFAVGGVIRNGAVGS
ncbi:permease [Haladaptatus sp. AB643]|uniref:permease n=1 Tax=Haladaptatus sp. AB643 TaxID=2934174 RepID=UPI00209C2B70|nr:permease [Haladaptatus sp. AB643]MCO8243590.1 permease [Haladaptatus sp. AB643]